jgi:prevent-host-death family protein
MTRKISAHTAMMEFDEIVNRAMEHNDRFLVERNGEPAVLILSVSDYIRTIAPTPEWLEESYEEARRTGLDKITMEEIDAEIAEHRREKRERRAKD